MDFFPQFRINNVTYHGELNSEILFKAICHAYSDDATPSEC